MKATRPMQGYSINIALTGQISKDSDQRVEYLGLHGERAWILVKDHFSRYLFGTCLELECSPLNWLCTHLSFYNPIVGTNCGCYVHMDQGGELYKNPRVCKMFEQQGFKIYPTGADASHQNVPVQLTHRSIIKGVCSFLIDANLPVKFWPYALYHTL